MSIRVLNGPQGQSGLRVEEYKRPKFEVATIAHRSTEVGRGRNRLWQSDGLHWG